MKVWKRLRQDRFSFACLIFLGIVVLCGILAPWIAPHAPEALNVKMKLAGPSLTYPLGTDYLGRCILSRLLWGIRTTVFLSIAAMAATILIGTVLGILAGVCRGWIDACIMRVCDVMLSFPGEVLTLAIVGVLGVGIGNVIAASIIAKWAWYTRMVRGIVSQYTDKNYIRFARVCGCSKGYIIQKHLLPGIAGELAVLATLDTGSVILNISALSFLGLGAQPPTPEWGMMLNEAKEVLITHPWQMAAPGIAIMAVVAAFQFLGDGLQAACDPRQTGKRPAMFLRREKAGGKMHGTSES